MKCFTVRFGDWHAPVDLFIKRPFDVGHEGKRLRVGAADIDRYNGFTLEHKDDTVHVPFHVGLLTDEFASVSDNVITICRAQLGTDSKSLVPEVASQRESKDVLVLLTAGGGYRLPFKAASLTADQQLVIAGGTCEWLLVLKPGQKVEADLETWGFLGAIKASWKRSTFTHCTVENVDGVLQVSHSKQNDR